MNLKHIIRDIGYFGVGAAAVLVEAGGKATQALVRKGEQTLSDNQDTVDDLKRRAKDFCAKAKERFDVSSGETAGVDAHQMTPEQRADLRRQLDEADEADQTETRPLAPDAISHADPAVSAEDAAREDEPLDAPDADETPSPRTADED